MTVSTDLVLELRPGLSGRVVAPGEPDDEAARTLFYGGSDQRPALIARVANAFYRNQYIVPAPAGGTIRPPTRG